MKKKFFIILLIILITMVLLAVFYDDILWFAYEKIYDYKYSNMYKTEEILSYNTESNLIEENSLDISNLKIILSDLEYTENELKFNLTFSHSKPLNHVGYILRVANKDYYLGDRFNGQISLSSSREWIISMNKFYLENFQNKISSRNIFKQLAESPENDYNLINYTSYQKQDEILENGSLLHKISFNLPEKFIIDDTLKIVLFDINYQNIGDSNFYQLKEPLSQITYTINNF